MRKTSLAQAVSISGYSFLGFPTTCVLEPTTEPGIHVELPNKQLVPLCEMRLETRKAFRSLVLRANSFALRVPEHLLGLLYALGLDGIVIKTQDFRLPYDGTALSFWKSVRHALVDVGELKWHSPLAPIEIGTGNKYLHLLPAPMGCCALTYEIGVDYRAFGQYRIRGTAGQAGDRSQLFYSRPYASRSHAALTRLARTFGWPHQDVGVPLLSRDRQTIRSVLEELCWHRQLDMLGAFLRLCPPGGRMAGTVLSQCAGHTMDVALANKLRTMQLMQV